MKMKIKYIASLLALAVTGSVFTACEDEPDKYEIAGGNPEVIYIRTPAKPDSLITAASTNTPVVLIGNNLRSIKALYFNDQKAALNTSYMTDHAVVVTVPKALPNTPTDKIYMYNKDGKVTEYPFSVTIDGPSLNSMNCEFVKPGDVATINGDFFLDYESDPMTITMPDGKVIDEFTKLTQYSVSFVVPEGCTTAGPIKVSTKYGTTASTKFNFNDKRGLITDFDGTTDVVPQGWNLKQKYYSEGGIDGLYAQLTGDLDENANWVEDIKLSFWCGNWNGDPLSITSGPGIPLCNFIDFSDWENMAIKFEFCVPASNPWKAGAMQIIMASAATCANDSWQNNTYIHTVANGGPGLCRGLYRPWEDKGTFDTDGKWITVTVPFKDFVYNYDGSKGEVPLTKDSFASLVIWINNGGVKGTACTPIVRYDNIRAVPYK